MVFEKKKFKIGIILLFGILFSLQFAFAEQPTQQYNRLFLSPFYVQSTTANTNIPFTISINPPDGVSRVTSAIVTFDILLIPSVDFTLLVNGQACNNPNYYLSTSYANAGKNIIYFDCSNVITRSGTYNLTLKGTKATGALTGWVDLTYMNNPLGEMEVHGTEYATGQTAKVWLQLVNNSGGYVNHGLCFVDILTPSNGVLIDGATMTNLNNKGVYTYDLLLDNMMEGVYPVVAECYYEAGQTNNYPINYSVEIGSYNAGLLSDLISVDGNFIRFKETSSGVRNISMVFNLSSNICKNISEEFLTGISVRAVAKFDSVVNDDITISIYNYTSSSWIELPNKLLEGADFSDVSNSFSFNNISETDFINGSRGVAIRFKDTSLTDGAQSNLDIDYFSVDCNQLANSRWQEIKGSSEIHLSSAGENTFYVESLCGESSLTGDYTSSCSQFLYNQTYYNVVWGYIYDRLTFINNYQTDTLKTFEYRTALGQDCTGIIDIIQTRGNVTSSIYEDVVLASGSKDNCVISIPVVFNSSDREFFVDITMENYMTWEAQRDNDFVRYFKQVITPTCNLLALQEGNPFVVPIDGDNDVSTLYASDPLYLGCYRAMDDIYWFDYYYDQSKLFNTSGEYESYLYNMRLYYSELREEAKMIQSITSLDITTIVETLCNGNDPDSSACAEIKSPDNYFSSQEGYIIENLTATNSFNTTLSTIYKYTTEPSVDCSAIMEIIKENGTSTDITDDVIFKRGASDNCEMSIPIDYVRGQASYNILIYMENYILWDIQWARDNVNLWNDTISEYCNDVSATYSVNYILPINSSIEQYRNNSDVYFCYRAMDDIYWWYYFYNGMLESNFTQIGSLGSYHYESEFFWQRIFNDYSIANTKLRRDVQIQTLQELEALRDSVAERVWNYSNKVLDYYPDSSVNYTEIALAIWGYENRSLTSFEFVVNANVSATQVAEAVWNYGGERNLTFYQVNNLTAEQIWNYTSRVLTFTEDTTDYSRISSEVWDFSNRTLTNFDFVTNIGFNLQDISEEVWNYEGDRNLTFYEVTQINNSEIALEVWQFSDRVLTYYEVSNLTAQEIWEYQNRSLTETGNIASAIWGWTGGISSSILGFFTTDIWEYGDRTLTSFGFDVVDENEIATYVWSYSNRTLTFYEVNDISPEEIWQYTSRNLTFTNDVTNYTLIGETTWNWVDRNLTMYPIGNNLSVADIWSYYNRSLSEDLPLQIWSYPNRNITTDIPFEVWSYSNRTLTYYTLNLTELIEMINEYDYSEIEIPFPSSEYPSYSLNVTLIIQK